MDKTDASTLEPLNSKTGMKTQLVPLPQGKKGVEKTKILIQTCYSNIDLKFYSARNPRWARLAKPCI